MKEQKAIVVLGETNCLGYAITKAFSFSPKYNVYTLNSSYGNRPYANTQLNSKCAYLDIEDINNDNCIKHMKESKVEKVFYCTKLFDLNTCNISTIDIDKVLDFTLSIGAEAVVFFETYTYQREERHKSSKDLLELKNNIKKLLNNKVEDIWLRIPQIYGVFQESNNLIPQLILKLDEYKLAYRTTDIMNLTYSEDIADFIVNQDGMSLEKNMISIGYDNLVKVIDCLKLSNYDDLKNYWIYSVDGERIYLNLENLRVRKFIYNMLEVLEHYDMNKSFYLKFL